MVEEDDWKDSTKVNKKAEKLWNISLIDQLITEVIQSSHSRAAALAVDSAAAKLMQNAENVSEYLSLRHQGLQQSIQSLQAHITSLLADIQEIEECQNQVTGDVRNYHGGHQYQNRGITDEGLCLTGGGAERLFQKR